MKPNLPNDLGKSLVRFFQDYLPTLRGLSQHTIRGYRDAIVLFLRYLTEHAGRPIEQLNLNDLTAEAIAQFLAFIEQKRGNSIATRNARLAALHTWARFLTNENPERLAQWQRVLALPLKRGAKQAPIEYLEEAEVKAVLGQIDRSTKAGQRDYALFCLMFNTGARVQEILDLRRSDIRTDAPYQVRLKGKCAKIRLCPIWPQTAKLLRQLASTTPDESNSESILFHNGRGGKLTRFGVRYLLHNTSSPPPRIPRLCVPNASIPTPCGTVRPSPCLRPESTLPPSASGWGIAALIPQWSTPAPTWISNAKRWHKCSPMFCPHHHMSNLPW